MACAASAMWVWLEVRPGAGATVNRQSFGIDRASCADTPWMRNQTMIHMHGRRETAARAAVTVYKHPA